MLKGSKNVQKIGKTNAKNPKTFRIFFQRVISTGNHWISHTKKKNEIEGENERKIARLKQIYYAGIK